MLAAACGPAGAPLSFADVTLPPGTVGLAYSAQLEAQGGTGALYYYLDSGSPPPGVTMSDTGVIAGTPTTPGVFTFTVDVSDRLDQYVLADITLEILADAPFTLEGLRLDDGYTDTALSQTLAAQGGAAPLRWAVTAGALPAGAALSEAGVLSGTPAAAGDTSFTVTVTDADARTATRALTLSVFEPPVLTTAALEPATAGEAYEQAVTHKGGKAPVTLAMTGALPDGLQWNGTSIVGTPSVASTTSLTFKLQDANGRESTSTLTLQVHDELVLITTGLPAAHTTRAYEQQLVVVGGAAPYVFALSPGALPPGLSLSSGGKLSGTPTATGSYAFTVEVTDARDENASRALSLDVFAPLQLSTPSLATAYTDSALDGSFAASGGKPPYVFALTTGSLPAGITLESDGKLSGTPTATGDFAITVEVVDALEESAVATTTLEVRDPVEISSVVLADAYVTESFHHTFEGTGGDGVLTWSVSAGALPSGLSLSAEGKLSGASASAGASVFTVRATDLNGRFDEAPLSLSVYEKPQLTTSSLPAAQVSTAYDHSVSSVGGKAPLGYSISSGALPAGLSLDASTGRISGTPQAVGTSTFTVRVADANARTDARTLTLEVAPVPVTGQFEVASWNIEWFGDWGEEPGNGPMDNHLQSQNAAQVIAAADIPVWGLVEMVDVIHFNGLLASLPGYSGFLADDFSVASGSLFYGVREQKPGFLYDASRVSVTDATLILTDYDVTFAGRPPLRVDAVVDVDGQQVELIFIVLHLKATKEMPSYEKRRDASSLLKLYLDTMLPTERVLVVGDWNDDVDVSITWDPINLTRMPTPFGNFVTDTADYAFLTSVLSDAGQTSTTGHGEMIDHHLATNELAAWHVGTPEVLRPHPDDVEEFDDKTSDHFPVVSRFKLPD